MSFEITSTSFLIHVYVISHNTSTSFSIDVDVISHSTSTSFKSTSTSFKIHMYVISHNRLIDHNGLFAFLGDAIISFMEAKPTPYGALALKSKRHFWMVSPYKRALTFVFLMRYMLGRKSQQQWKKFKMSDFKFNTRCFNRWNKNEQDIVKQSPKFNKLDEDYTVPHGGKRKAVSTSSDVTISEESPLKRVFVVGDDSTDDDE